MVAWVINHIVIDAGDRVAHNAVRYVTIASTDCASEESRKAIYQK